MKPLTSLTTSIIAGLSLHGTALADTQAQASATPAVANAAIPADALAPLRYMPPDVSTFFCLDVTAGSQIAEKLGLGEIDNSVSQISIGLTQGTDIWINRICSAQGKGNLVGALLSLEDKLEEWFHNDMKEPLKQFKIRNFQQQRKYQNELLYKDFDIKPIYIVLQTPKDSGAEGIRHFFRTFVSKSDPGFEPYADGTWQGYKIDVMTALNHRDAIMNFPLMIKTFKDFHLYFVYRIEGDTAILAFSSSPQSLKVPASADASLAAHIKPATLTTISGKQAIFAASIEPQIINAIGNIFRTFGQETHDSLRFLMATVEKTQPKHAAGMQKGQQALDTLATEFPKLLPVHTGSTDIVIWNDGVLNILTENDACGAHFSAGICQTTVPRQAIFHAYGTPLHVKEPFEADKTINAAFDLSSAITSILAPELSKEGKQYISIAKMSYNMLKTKLAPIAKMAAALDGAWSFTADGEGEIATPIDLGDSVNETTPEKAARFTLTLNVADRNKLAQTGSSAARAVSSALGMVSPYTAAMFRPSAYEAHTAGNTTYYTLKKQKKTEMNPCCAVSDTRLILGTDTTLVTAMMQEPAGDTTAGMGFTFNNLLFEEALQPVAPTMEARLELPGQEAELPAPTPQTLRTQNLPPLISEVSGKININNGRLRTHLKLICPALR